MNRIFIYILLILLISTNVYAAVTGVTGSVSQGEDIIITGSSFGTKSTAAPLKWYDFEGTTLGNSIGTETDWSENSVNDILISDQNQVNAFSSRNIIASVSRPSDDADIAWLNNLGFASTGKVYVNLWLRMNYGTNEVTSSQVKTFRIDVRFEGSIVYPATAQLHWSYAGFPDPGGYTRAYYQHYYGLTGACDGRSVNSYEENNNYNNVDDATPLWVQVTLQIEQGDEGVANGDIIYSSYKLNGSTAIKRYSNNDILIRCNSDYMDGMLLQNYIGTGALETVLYYDNIYIDNSWSRVELGDEAVYENCTKMEPLIPSAWATGEITATVNQGVFAAAETAYVFVINDGVPSAGFEVIIGGGANPVVTLEADKQATSPTTYTGSFTVSAGRTGTLPVSSNAFTVTCDDGDCTDEETEAFTVSGVTVPITDTITVTDSSAEEGFDSITITLPATSTGTVGGAKMGGAKF